MAGQALTRLLAVASLVLAVAVVAVLLLGSSGSYRIQAQFTDAGQLVPGDLVEVGGRTVGKITAIRLTDDGLADVELTLSDDAVTPLHQGTIAAIRTVGLAAITNRFVDLSPGPPQAPRLASGAILPTSQTRGIVDLDVLLDTVDPTVRSHLRAIVRQAAVAFSQPAAGQVNAGLAYLNPALGQIAGLGHEVVLDQAALSRLVTAGATAAHALASRQADVGAGIDAAAATLGQVATERRALTDLLDRAPAVLQQARGTLAGLDRALPAVDPVLRELRPAVAPLADVLRRTVSVTHDATPAITAIRALLPRAVTALGRIPALQRRAAPALASTTTALRMTLPIVAGLRAYAPDLVNGLFSGFGGDASGYYDANGHYIRIALEGAPSSLPGLLNAPSGTSLPSGGYRTGLIARCPGGAEEPAPDGSNPWVPFSGICDPSEDHK
jgi:phospholipid/cholesterol/gamma-HCH transport system substrate-binding protein